MSTVKCSVCNSVCAASLTICDTCGNPLNVKPTGFGQPPVQSGFGQPPVQSGFGQPPVQSGFGKPPVPTGFGQPVAPTGFGQPVAPTGFGQPVAPTPAQPQTGFGQPSVPTGFGQEPAQPNVAMDGFVQPVDNSLFDAPSAGMGFIPSVGVDMPTSQGAPFGQEAQRFVDTASMNQEMSPVWGFGKTLIFMLKTLIPIYGLIILVLCALGNPRKYPTQLTTYIRASIVYNIILLLIMSMLTFALGLAGAGLLSSFGG